MSTLKAEAKQIIDQLPEGSDWSEVAYRMVVRAKIERGLAAAPGDLIPHDRMMQEMEEWLASLGRPMPDSTSNGS